MSDEKKCSPGCDREIYKEIWKVDVLVFMVPALFHNVHL